MCKTQNIVTVKQLVATGS